MTLFAGTGVGAGTGVFVGAMDGTGEGDEDLVGAEEQLATRGLRSPRAKVESTSNGRCRVRGCLALVQGVAVRALSRAPNRISVMSGAIDPPFAP